MSARGTATGVDLDAGQVRVPAGHPLARVGMIAFGVGALGLVVALLMARGDTRAFAFSWLVAFLFTLSIALGSLYFVLVHTAMQGGWGVVVRRLAENAMATIPVFALLLVPILLFREELFPWIREIAEGKDHLLHGKEPYLNVPFFLTRAVVYMVVWSAIALFFFRGSRRQDATGDHAISARLRQWSGPAIIALGLTHIVLESSTPQEAGTANLRLVQTIDPADLVGVLQATMKEFEMPPLSATLGDDSSWTLTQEVVTDPTTMRPVSASYELEIVVDGEVAPRSSESRRWTFDWDASDCASA